MQQRYLFAFELAALCLLASCQSKQAGPPSPAEGPGQTRPWALRLDLDQAREDLDYFFRTVEKVHPNRLANLSRKDYRQLKEQSRVVLEQACAKTGYVSKPVLALTIAEAAAALGDGHTFCHLGADLIDPCDDCPCMPPFRMGWYAGQIVISDTREDLQYLRGARLLRINDRPLEEVLEPIVAKCSGERREHRIGGFLGAQDVYWALVRPVDGKRITLTVRGTTGDVRTLTLDLIPLSRYRKEVPPGPRRPAWGYYKLFQNDRTCYWQYNSCNPTAQGREFIGSVFQAIRDHKTENLILDLRFNGGGSDNAVQAVVEHLTAKPYRLHSRIGGRISDPLLRADRQWYLRPLKGLYLSAPVRARAPREVKNRFTGCVYVLTSPDTFSSAAGLAAVLKDYGLATLIGEETGGLRQSFGEAYGHRLPHSGVDFSVSGKLFYAPIPQPDDAKRGTVPDIVLTPRRLAPFRGFGDPEVVYTMDLIEKRGVQPPSRP